MPARRERSHGGSFQDLSNFPEQNPNPMLRLDRGGQLLYANSAARSVRGLIRKADHNVPRDLAESAKRAWKNKAVEKADLAKGVIVLYTSRGSSKFKILKEGGE